MYILIVNEQPLGRSLAATLVKHGHEVAYVDDSPEFCELVSTEVGCLVIQGETTNLRILQEAGLKQAEVIVSLLDKDIKNVMVCLFARQFNVPRILAGLNQQHYRAAYELIGITDIFSAFDFLLNEFLMAIEEPNVRHVMSLSEGYTEIAAIDVPPESPLMGSPLGALWEHKSFPEGALILGLLKDHERSFHLPRERPSFAADDEVLVLGSPEDIRQIAEILDNSGSFLSRTFSRSL